MNHIGLFEGIGGFSIAGHWAGWETIAWCEYASFPQKVLRHHFPTADELHDVTTADFTIYRGRVDVLTGGFPCQPFSQAGQRRGTDDDRHLWPHMLRAIQECRPTWVIGENVAGLASMAFPPRHAGVDLCTTVEGQEAHRDMEAAGVLDSICGDLEREGYDVQPIVVPACATNAPHRRDRIWIIGYNAANDNERSRPQHGLCTGRQVSEIGADRGGASTHTHGYTERPHGYSDKSGVGGQVVDSPQEQGGHAEAFFDKGYNNLQSSAAEHGRGAAANAKGGRSGRIRDTQGEAGPREGSELLGGGSGMADEHGNAADTDMQRCEECDAVPQPREKERQHRATHRAAGPRGWQDFPTEPPVCGGNDGISDLLDADAIFEGKKGGKRTATAAYNHWRNETIKAYGNAIVPQAFFEIAKAINACNPK